MKKSIRIISIFLVLGLIAGALGMFAKLTDNFKNWDQKIIEKKSKDLFKNKVGFNAYNTKTGEAIDFNTNENLSFDDGIAFRTKVTSDEKIEGYQATTFVFNFKASSEKSNIKVYKALLKYKDGKEDKVKEVTASIKDKKLTLTCKKPFDRVIILSIVAIDNKEVKKEIQLDFEEFDILTKEHIDSVILNNKNIIHNFKGTNPFVRDNIKDNENGYLFNIFVKDLRDKIVAFDNGVNNYFHFENKVKATKRIGYHIKSSTQGINHIGNEFISELNKLTNKNYDVTNFVGCPYKDILNESYLTAISFDFLDNQQNYQAIISLLKKVVYDITYDAGYPEDKKLSYDNFSIRSKLVYVS